MANNNKLSAVGRLVLRNLFWLNNRKVIHGPHGLMWTSTKVPYIPAPFNHFAW